MLGVCKMHDELTRQDIKKMEEEIEHRKLVVRKQALEDVKEARAQGDLSENFEYKAAKKFKNANESRIRYLENMIKTAIIIDDESKSDEVDNFIREIEPALWRKNEMTGKVDRTQILLKSEVVSDSGNELLRNILETGATANDVTDNYSKNYNKFIELYAEKSQKDPLQMFQFILSLLKYTILLPIDADDQETALTIFNTLNNRGLPLSDADIFKSHIYKTLNDVEKKTFIEKWKKLETDSAKVSESIQSLFYYHMFYIRAK